MSNDYQRETGKRLKYWGSDGDPKRQMEAATELPMMYRWLGTEPRKEHPFNLYGDISIQPKALKDTLEANREAAARIADEMVRRGINRIVGTGLGTSQFVAQAAAAAFWKYSGIDAIDVDSLEYVTFPRPYDYARLGFFVYSGSGSTVDSNRAGRKAKELGAYTVAFTSVDGSPVTQFCEGKLVCAGGFDTGGSDTFHYTTRLAVSILLAIELGKRLQPKAYDYADLEKRLFAIPDKFAAMFEAVDARCRSMAARYHGVRAAIVVGNGANLGSAEEMALKFDEMAHLPTKAMCPDRHIHGALGLTDERILTIIMAPREQPAYKELTDIAKATQMIKSPSIAIVSEDDDEISNLVDDVIRLPETSDILFPLLNILPSQLLPYYCAVAQGDINPDTQRSNIPKYARVWNMLFPPGSH